jgi:hypothetical protein
LIKTMSENILSTDFLKKYEGKNPNWGFNGLGYIVYKRTYARPKDNGTTEEWNETVARCVQGAQDIGADYTKEEAERLYDHIFNLRCNFAGRMLWQLGSPTVKRYGGASLLNCWFTSMNELEDFCFVFENLMLGGGVGFSVKREDIHELPKVKSDIVIEHLNTNDADFIVPDSREGWVSLFRHVILAFLNGGKSFTYSTILVRGKGEKICGFGGTASGPGILVEGIQKICTIFRGREGKKLRSIDVLDINNILGSIVVSGNVRRSAELALGDPDDHLFVRAKNWSLGDIPNWRSMSNNSIYADSYSHISRDVWETGYEVDEKTGKAKGEPYGFINLPLSQKFGRIGDGPMKDCKIYPTDKDNCEGMNPCLTGDTLVYVADGRGNVPIKTLSDEGKDVPVFCLNNKNKIDIRYMRHPRITGKGASIYKITIENGHSFTSTGNHKLKLTNGEYKEVSNLTPGDSLKILTKYHASIKDIFPDANSHSQDYVWLTLGGSTNRAEHTYIAEFYNNTKMKTGLVVHHNDFDAQNNDPENLKIMTKTEHDLLHSKNMIGDNNPMRRAKIEWSVEKWSDYKKNMSDSVSGDKNPKYSGYTNEELKEHAIILTKELQRRFSCNDWMNYAKSHGLPISFSSWRKNHLGGIMGLSKFAALELGIDNIDEDPRTVKIYKDMVSQGYDAEIVDGEVYVNKTCEITGKSFKVPYSRKEVCVIDRSAQNKKRWMNPDYRIQITNSNKKTWEAKKQVVREKQTELLSNLNFKLSRVPTKKEWASECKLNNISCEISRKTSPFKNYDELITAASEYNHKVVSVEFVGLDDVYNGTVDDFHNFFIGGWEERTANDKPKFIYLNNQQCGEITLADGEACNLAEIYLNNIESEEVLNDCAQLLYKTQKAVWTLPFHYDKTVNIVKKNMRIGLGITGVCQSTDKLDWLDKCYKNLRKFDAEWSKKKNWPQSIKLTTVKPSGTLSLLGGSTPGGHPAYSDFYIRRVRMAANDKLVSVCRDLGYFVESVKNFDNTDDIGTVVVSFPCKAGKNAVVSKNMTAVQQLELLKKLQTIWSDNAVSVTVYYHKEELPIIKEWMKSNYEVYIKSVSFLLHSEHGFKQAPYEEITEEKYLSLIENVKPLTTGQNISGTSLDIECANGSCPIK